MRPSAGRCGRHAGCAAINPGRSGKPGQRRLDHRPPGCCRKHYRPYFSSLVITNWTRFRHWNPVTGLIRGPFARRYQPDSDGLMAAGVNGSPRPCSYLGVNEALGALGQSASPLAVVDTCRADSPYLCEQTTAIRDGHGNTLIRGLCLEAPLVPRRLWIAYPACREYHGGQRRVYTERVRR